MTQPPTHSQQSSSDGEWHVSVLLDEVVTWLEGAVKGEEICYVVDGTVGGGGHALELLTRCPNVRLLGIDRDLESIERARGTLEKVMDRVVLRHGSYADIESHLEAAGFPKQVDGITLDLGVNSHQIDTAERGFSFRFDGPLDMRFNPDDPSLPTAADLVNELSEGELIKIFREWGEEKRAKAAARAILRYREEQPFERTGELYDCLYKVLFSRKKGPKRDPVTRCFQALRIAVNQELHHLDTFLEQIPSWLVPGGRIAIISFHSLEDRRVKHGFRELARGCICPPDLPVCGCGQKPKMKVLTRRSVEPSEEEVTQNARARSARLRVAEKVAEDEA